MRIILDVMGGDNAPIELVKGAAMAVNEYSIDITLVGNKDLIEKVVKENNISLSNIDVVHTTEFITMEDSPLSVVKNKSTSSMSIGLKLLAEGKGEAFVSAGNTGALLAGSSFIVRRIKGMRAAIATVLPVEKPTLLLDSGANTTVTEVNMEQFAMMGSVYMEKIFHAKNPKIGLLNNGSEKSKGTPLLVETYKRLQNSQLNFIGNIEGKDIPFGKCDVIVTDGFTGNIVLKTVEGLGSFFMKKMKGMFFKNTLTKISALIVKSELKNLKKDFDTSEYGGAPLLGLSKPVIKAHGNSDAKAIKNAIRQAINYINTGVIADIAKFSTQISKDTIEHEQEN